MNALTRKLGPFPAYVWAGVAVAAILLIVELRRRHSASATTQAVADTVAANDTSGDATDASQVPGAEYANTGADMGMGSGAYGFGDPTYEGSPATAGPAITTSDFLKLEQDTAALTAAERADALADRKTPATVKPLDAHQQHLQHERNSGRLDAHQQHLLHERNARRRVRR